MARITRASAPGKCILMGEHAAVYGGPAVVAAIDCRLEVKIELQGVGSGKSSLELHLPDLGVRQGTSWAKVYRYTNERRAIWKEQDDGGGVADFAKLRGDDPAHVVKAALGELLISYVGEERLPKEDAVLEVTSAIPVGSGFGSSAACSAAVILAAAEALDLGLTNVQLGLVTSFAEKLQHGWPSGIDAMTVFSGGVGFFQREGNSLSGGRRKVREPFMPNLRFFQTGEPAEPTGAVVAAVRALREKDPETFDRRIQDMGAATSAFSQEIVAETPRDEKVISLFRSFETYLEAIGVVPPEIQGVIREIERQGGAAKISGAGSLRGPGAGSLLVLEPPPGLNIEWPAAFKELKLELGAPGARLE